MWYYDNYWLPYTQERVIPTGTTTLVINFALREATLCGAHAQPFLLATDRMISHLGVHFWPGGLAPFLPFPAQELQNCVISLDLLWGSAVFPLRDQLLAAQTPAAKFHTLENALAQKLTESRNQHPAVRFALHYFQQESITPLATVIKQTGLSTRHFRKLFQETVGLSPKRFRRVQRFQHVLQAIETPEHVNWSEVALIHGYADQAHLIHDFQEFAGLSPTNYLTQRSRHRNHIPL